MFGSTWLKPCNPTHYHPSVRLDYVSSEGPLQSLDILLIEDNLGDALLVRQILAESGMNVTVHLAMDGQQALQMLSDPNFAPNLIILDLNIPKIPGLTLLERLSGKTPVVIFSSTASEHEKQRALALGARDFVSKPSDLGEFTDSVCGIVRKWAIS